jgi:hypothetical protein
MNPDNAFAKSVADLLRKSVQRNVSPDDLYWICHNQELMDTAALYERVSEDLRGGLRKYLPSEDELLAVKKEAWRLLDGV